MLDHVLLGYEADQGMSTQFNHLFKMSMNNYGVWFNVKKQ